MQHKKGIGGQAKRNTMAGILEGIGCTKIDLAELAYKKMLLQVSKMLDGFSLSGLKFLCEKQIPKSVRERIVEPIHLWLAMQERGLLGPDNLKFLKWMLKEGAENRTDLVLVVERYEQEYVVVQEEAHGHSGEVQEESCNEAKVLRTVSENSSRCPQESSLCGQMGNLSIERHSWCGGWESGRGNELKVPQQVERVAKGANTGSYGLRSNNFGSGMGRGSGISRADFDADTKDLVEKEVDSEADTKIGRTESATKEVGSVRGTDDDAETKDVVKCVVEFHYPADVPAELKPFYPKETKLSENHRFLFGRGKNVNVKLNDEAISREQFDIKLMYSESLKRYGMVLTNLSKIRTVILDNQELGCGDQRPLSAVSTLLIKDLDIMDAVKFIIVVHIPQHFNGAEFEVIFQQDGDFYERLIASIEESWPLPGQPIIHSAHGQSLAAFVPSPHPSAVNVQHGVGMLANSPPGPGHQYLHVTNPHQYLGFPPVIVSNHLPAYSDVGPRPWAYQNGSAINIQGQSNYPRPAAGGVQATPQHNYSAYPRQQQYRMPQQEGPS